ncbi:hypothetical protein RB2150_02199 [Rhodobacteraceae bacterium HTCC2150]|nr:hypothetical protein RB2150_02199 [Rhodobacteraceae bacterium HTCC2150]
MVFGLHSLGFTNVSPIALIRTSVPSANVTKSPLARFSTATSPLGVEINVSPTKQLTEVLMLVIEI